MSRRASAEHRCPRCRLHAALCLCAEVRRCTTKNSLLLVVHRREAQKPTTSGGLAALVLAKSRTIIVDGQGGPAVDADPDTSVMLFPAPKATPLADVVADRGGAPLTLVVPDGTWAEAQKMRRRVPGLATLPCATLPAGPPTAYRLRHEPKEGGLATLEAIARAFAILEGDGSDVEDALMQVFARFVERTLWMRGTLRDDELRFGLPEAARLLSPRGARSPAAH